MPPADKDAWMRLGRLLAGRRIQIGARYKNKNLFADERELNRRMLWQIEGGRRDTYRGDTIRAVESAYMLVPGSLGRTLAGGDLEPIPEPHPNGRRAPSAADLYAQDDPVERVIRLLIEALDPSRPRLQEFLRDVMALIDGNGEPRLLSDRAALMLVLLERDLEPQVQAAGRRNGTTDLPPPA